jgi:hypothetical protein
MGKNKFVSEYILNADGTEVCSECGHLWAEVGAGHYQECRYYTLEDALEEDESIGEIIFNEPQLSLFRPAA